MNTNRKVELLWAVSLLCGSVIALLLIGSRFLPRPLPVWLLWTFGILDLAAIPVLVYTTVWKLRNRPKE